MKNEMKRAAGEMKKLRELRVDELDVIRQARDRIRRGEEDRRVIAEENKKLSL